jgi:hypothetical protein
MSQEIRHMAQETNGEIKRINRGMADFGDRIGELVEEMIANGLKKRFMEVGYEFDDCIRRREFSDKALGIRGEIDFLLANKDVAMLIEVKTRLQEKDVVGHIVRIGKYSDFASARGYGQTLVGAVYGGVIEDEAREFALENGLYVIEQSGDAVSIISPKNGEARRWQPKTKE